MCDADKEIRLVLNEKRLVKESDEKKSFTEFFVIIKAKTGQGGKEHISLNYSTLFDRVPPPIAKVILT